MTNSQRGKSLGLVHGQVSTIGMSGMVMERRPSPRSQNFKQCMQSSTGFKGRSNLRKAPEQC